MGKQYFYIHVCYETNGRIGIIKGDSYLSFQAPYTNKNLVNYINHIIEKSGYENWDRNVIITGIDELSKEIWECLNPDAEETAIETENESI